MGTFLFSLNSNVNTIKARCVDLVFFFTVLVVAAAQVHEFASEFDELGITNG